MNDEFRNPNDEAISWRADALIRRLGIRHLPFVIHSGIRVSEFALRGWEGKRDQKK